MFIHLRYIVHNEHNAHPSLPVGPITACIILDQQRCAIMPPPKGSPSTSALCPLLRIPSDPI